ncbi:FtsW/RodA/SpoVE family cell cycle protein [Fredinandcohnia sp. QZ13]|uniref:FtsW/RodA/SpoVE family cell cycle protein n=1 Tax=Fredinandcohnia sp. QZ13 TaxID=3073144 RepID=UPI0028533A10|nr:FtsW/RodA/SpoVE family cell cycle protein [Fredinandcohnia sp. QZ13]MDR4886639.1 FtsW/RodA/SpoVE family cell cycle protein [Fredinandcohnia sp. QZ13]
MLKKILKSYDYTLVVAVFLLCSFGLVMVYSASMVIASAPKFGENPSFFFDRQKVALLAGTAAFFVTMILPYKIYASKKILLTIVLGSVAMLLLVFVVGHTANNAQSWIMVGARGIQPSEFTKLSVIIYLAAVYSKKQAYINQFGIAVMPPIIFTLGLCMTVAIQPDFGTAFIIGLIALTIILCSGMGIKSLGKLIFLGFVTAVLLSPLLYILSGGILSEGRMGRFLGFMNPFEDEKNGYQLVNSYIALGAGGWKGLGLGQSIQKFNYLPEAHTDFIMAIIAEELGLFGVLFVLLLLAYIVLRGFQIARKCTDPFGSLLAIGISSMIAIQTFINLGGLTGLIPITGVTLPFISYGGSSLLLLMASMGILINVSMFTNYQSMYLTKEKQPQSQPARSFQKNYVSYR